MKTTNEQIAEKWAKQLDDEIGYYVDDFVDENLPKFPQTEIAILSAIREATENQQKVVERVEAANERLRKQVETYEAETKEQWVQLEQLQERIEECRKSLVDGVKEFKRLISEHGNDLMPEQVAWWEGRLGMLEQCTNDFNRYFPIPPDPPADPRNGGEG